MHNKRIKKRWRLSQDYLMVCVFWTFMSAEAWLCHLIHLHQFPVIGVGVLPHWALCSGLGASSPEWHAGQLSCLWWAAQYVQPHWHYFSHHARYITVQVMTHLINAQILIYLCRSISLLFYSNTLLHPITTVMIMGKNYSPLHSVDPWSHHSPPPV